jgi:hypothetical protein
MPNKTRGIVAVSARRVDAIITRLGLTNRALAKRMRNKHTGALGSDETSLSRTLNRIRDGYRVNPDTAARLAEALGVKIEDILKG